MPEQSKPFVVTDRRKFTMDGELREPSEATPEAVPTLGVSAPPPSPAPPPVQAASDPVIGPAAPIARDTEPEDDGDPGFERIVLSFTQSAMMQLGLVAMDPGQPLEPDMMGARETIDMLAVLEIKTRGNLNAREKRLIHETLHELQLAYVGVQRQMVKPRQ